MKIITIVGARPQFIKAAMLSREFAQHTEVDEIVLHTGQHYDANMSDIFFAELDLPAPKYNLGIHKASHGAMTGAMLTEIEKILIQEKPSLVVVYGDTDSTLAGALAAAKLLIPIAHVEAGLRSFNRAMPEEINRVVTDHLSELLFAPTATAASHLTSENRPQESIFIVGDIMYDAALKATENADSASILRSHNLGTDKYTLATLHRAENTDTPNRLFTWLEALNKAARERPIILPLHPRTKQRITKLGKSPNDYPHIKFVEPLGYQEMAVLTKHAELVITDSGGLQKEAYFHKTPCLIMRTETEWVELIENGWSQLLDCDEEAFLEGYHSHKAPTEPDDKKPFGEGRSAEKICASILDFLK